MKSVVLGAAAAAMLAVTNPASAEVVARNRDDVIIRDHEHGRSHLRSWYRDHAECRTVRVRTQSPSGKVVLKARRSC
jgi:2-keto-3-deoxy-L-rhamnonate aldolase RhmA